MSRSGVAAALAILHLSGIPDTLDEIRRSQRGRRQLAPRSRVAQAGQRAVARDLRRLARRRQRDYRRAPTLEPVTACGWRYASHLGRFIAVCGGLRAEFRVLVDDRRLATCHACQTVMKARSPARAVRRARLHLKRSRKEQP